MIDLVLLIAFILSIVLVATDAYRLERQGVHVGGPAGWAVAMILVWIVAFPMYLVKREKHLADETEVLLPKVAGWLLFFFTVGCLVFPYVQQENADIADRLVNYTPADLVSEEKNNGYSYEAPFFTSVIDPYPDYRTPNCRYEGGVEEGLPHGRGRHLCVRVGEGPVIVYEGGWKYGAYHGQGTWNMPYGAKYVGEFKDGDWHGQGTMTRSDGSKYVGEFKDGDYNGQGTMTYPDGRKFVGEFKDGEAHNGRGYLKTLEFSGGVEGEWLNGEINGQATQYFSDGSKYVGEFKDSKKHGQGTEFSADGSVKHRGWWCTNYYRDDGLCDGDTRASFKTTGGLSIKELARRCSNAQTFKRLLVDPKYGSLTLVIDLDALGNVLGWRLSETTIDWDSEKLETFAACAISNLAFSPAIKDGAPFPYSLELEFEKFSYYR